MQYKAQGRNGRRAQYTAKCAEHTVHSPQHLGSCEVVLQPIGCHSLFVYTVQIKFTMLSVTQKGNKNARSGGLSQELLGSSRGKRNAAQLKTYNNIVKIIKDIFVCLIKVQ